MTPHGRTGEGGYIRHLFLSRRVLRQTAQARKLIEKFLRRSLRQEPRGAYCDPFQILISRWEVVPFLLVAVLIRSSVKENENGSITEPHYISRTRKKTIEEISNAIIKATRATLRRAALQKRPLYRNTTLNPSLRIILFSRGRVVNGLTSTAYPNPKYESPPLSQSFNNRGGRGGGVGRLLDPDISSTKRKNNIFSPPSRGNHHTILQSTTIGRHTVPGVIQDNEADSTYIVEEVLKAPSSRCVLKNAPEKGDISPELPRSLHDSSTSSCTFLICISPVDAP